MRAAQMPLRSRCLSALERVPSLAVMNEPGLPERRFRGPGGRPGASAAWRWAVDAAVALGVTAGQVGGSYAATSRHPGHPPAATLAYVLLTVGGASLIARRRYPVGVLALVLTRS